MQSRQKAILTVKILILLGVLYWLINSFSEDDWQTLKNQPKNWWLLSLGAATVLVAHIVSFLRWMILVRTLGVPFSVLEAIRLGFLGNLFNMVSAGSVGGDVFKAIAAARHIPEKRPEVVGSVLVDRAVGLLGLVIVASVGLVVASVFAELDSTLKAIRNGAIAVTVVGISGLMAVTLFGRRLPFHLLGRIPYLGTSFVRLAESGLVLDGRLPVVLLLMAVSCSVHCLLTTATFLISQSMYASPPTLGEHFQVVPPAMAAGALPLTPGGVGLQEAAIAGLFERLPNMSEGFSGVVVAAMYRLFLLLVAGIGAVFYVTGFGSNRLASESSDSESVPESSGS